MGDTERAIPRKHSLVLSATVHGADVDLIIIRVPPDLHSHGLALHAFIEQEAFHGGGICAAASPRLIVEAASMVYCSNVVSPSNAGSVS